jgi:hypothetical protein
MATRPKPARPSLPAKFDTFHRMNYVKITTEQVVAEDDAEALIELMKFATDQAAGLLTVYDSVVASMNTTEPENAAEVARP